MTESSASQRDRIDELAESFVARFRSGERPSIDEYARKYPELADELRELLPALVMLEQHGSPEDTGGLGGAAPRPAPRELGDFTIVREIGRGGMGVVYEAVQQSLGRHVALKVLSSPGLLNPVHLERFRLEARSAGRLHHSHIVPVFGVGEDQGLHYYAMQFIAGQSLDQVIEALRKLRPDHGVDKTAPLAKDDFTESLTNGLLTGHFPGHEAAAGSGVVVTAPGEPGSGVSDDGARSDGQSHFAPQAAQNRESPRPIDRSLSAHREFSSSSSGRPFYDSVARVGLQVAEALAYAHAEGVLHRDIKPSNLLLDAKGNIWVTDFGLAKAEENDALTATGDFVGTLRYMAPERLEGWSDRRSDIYGLGVTLYELLTLHPFFETANRASLIDNIRHQNPQPPTKIDRAVPRDLETIVLKALAKEPSSRYHTAEEMADDLRRFLADRPILARRSTVRERLVRWCRRNPVVASLAATVALALVAGTIASTWQAIRATRATQRAEATLAREVQLRRAAEAGERIRQARILQDKWQFDRAEELLNAIPPDLVVGDPMHADMRRLLGTLHALHERWKEASDNFATLLKVHDPDTDREAASLDYLFYAPVLVLLGDTAGYARLQEEATSDYVKSANSVNAERICKICLLLPANEKVMSRLGKLYDVAVTGLPPRPSESRAWASLEAKEWASLALAMVDYRRGDYRKAIEWWQACVKPKPERTRRSAAAYAIGAMAHYQLGQHAEAQNALSLARHAHEQITTNVIAKEPGPSELVDLFDGLIAHILIREADALINGSPLVPDKGYPLAQKVLGDMYADGWYVHQSDTDAVKWYRKAAEQGLREAQVTLARSLVTGRGVSKDPAEAAEWLLKADERADGSALNSLAWQLVTDPDPKKWDSQAAVVLAEHAVKKSPANGNFWNALGVAQYRDGSWDDAIMSLTKAEELARDKYLAFNGFFLAMAHWQLDHKDEARKWYDRSVEWMDKNQPKNEELVRFRAEAEQLLSTTKPNPASKDSPQADDSAKPKT
jgi:serine/threonine protein kinase/TPR repeat protein